MSSDPLDPFRGPEPPEDSSEDLPEDSPEDDEGEDSAPARSDLLAGVEADVESDYRYARELLRELAGIGLAKTKRLSEIVDQVEDVRTFEALSTLMRNTADIGERMVGMQKSVMEIALAAEREAAPSNSPERIVFEGTGPEIQKLLQRRDGD